MTAIDAARAYWNRHASRDPLWAVLSDSSRTDRRWDLPSFMQTGEREIALLFHEIAGMNLAVARGAAADFGCGVGRLTQALARRFESVVGFDVSPDMVRLARAINKYGSRVSYEVNDGSLGRRLPGASVDFVYSTLVLQHVPPEESGTYIRDLVQGLRPGGLFVFQLPAARAEVPRGPVPMPESAYRARVAIARPIPPQLETSAAANLLLEIINVTDTAWSQPDVGGIRAGNHWLDEAGEMVVQDDGRASLPSSVGPGGNCRIQLEVRAPDRPGKYVLEVDIVHEGISWFSDRGSATVRVPVDIVAPAASREPHSRPVNADVARASTVPDYSDVALSDLLPAFDGAAAVSDFPMHGMPRDTVASIVAAAGGEVVHVVDDDHAKPEWDGYKYFVRKLKS
jgi:SAM-dependent methyltransferase